MKEVPPAEHLVGAVGDWFAWRMICVRGTGFPISTLTPLTSPLTARAVDALLRCEQELERAMRDALEATKRAWEVSEGERRRALARVLKRLRAGRVPEDPHAVMDVPTLARLRDANDATELARGALASTYDAERLRIGEALRELSRTPRFRDAVLWQNRRAVQTGLDALLRQPPAAADSETRKKELLVARYAQRYSVKNESVGFFGPIGWGEVDPDGDAFVSRPGVEVASRPTVHLEAWAVQALADTLTSIPGVKQWLWPRRFPLARVEGTALITPFGASKLSPLEARVLSACDGGTPATTIADRLAGEDEVTRDAVLDTISSLEKRSLVRWHLDVQNMADHFDVALRADLASIGDDEVRARALQPLDRLVRARDEVAAADGPQELERALAALDDEFTQLTQQQSTRHPGQTYASRTLVVPVSRRNVEVRLGRAVLDRLGTALEPMLLAARWWSFHVADAVQRELRCTFDDMTRGQPSRSLDLAAVWPAVAGLFPRVGGVYGPAIQRVISEYRERWEQLLQARGAVSAIERSSADVAPLARKLFAAPHPGWPMARYHSPDILLAAQSADAIARGEFTAVLGELHTFANTIQQLPAVRAHPEPARILRGMEWDLPSGRLTPASLRIGLSAAFTEHPKDVAVEHDVARSWRPRSQVLPIADLAVVEIDGELAIRSRDGRHCWSVAAALDSLLADFNVGMLGDREHTPRIALDGVVLARESWRMAKGDLRFSQEKTQLSRFVACRKWAVCRGLPRHAFYKISSERKPFYVDFESPIFVESFAKTIGSAEHVTIGEMLPDPDQCWLSDAEGARYTSELRMVFVDRQPYAQRPWEH